MKKYIMQVNSASSRSSGIIGIMILKGEGHPLYILNVIAILKRLIIESFGLKEGEFLHV